MGIWMANGIASIGGSKAYVGLPESIRLSIKSIMVNFLFWYNLKKGDDGPHFKYFKLAFFVWTMLNNWALIFWLQ